MTYRDVVLAAIRYENPPYVPWHVSFTAVPAEKVARHFGTKDIDVPLRNHMITFRSPVRTFTEEAPGMFRDVYGGLWDRRVDSDIGLLVEPPLKGPTLNGFRWPVCAGNEEKIRATLAAAKGRASHLSFGFTMFERAWGLRGMENLLMDFAERPAFVHELLDAICEHDLNVLRWAEQFKPDIIHFGDDWGQQHGLIMGPHKWREFIRPRVARLYARAHEMGALVSIHCCGDVDELFDDLVQIGVNLFNPFQPEVMDTVALRRQYHGRLAFHGGLSIQRVLPFGTPDEVRAETRRLLRELGQGGGYICAPAHAVPADVPLENILAFLDVLHSQPGFKP